MILKPKVQSPGIPYG